MLMIMCMIVSMVMMIMVMIVMIMVVVIVTMAAMNGKRLFVGLARVLETGGHLVVVVMVMMMVIVSVASSAQTGQLEEHQQHNCGQGGIAKPSRPLLFVGGLKGGHS